MRRKGKTTKPARKVTLAESRKLAKPSGRPPMLTKQISDRICESISHGMFLTQAAKLAGVSTDAIEQWREKGARGVEPYASFLKAFEAAELTGEQTLVKIWKDSAPEDWRAAKELLAKRFPERWSDHAGRRAVFGSDEGGESLHTGLNITIHFQGDEYWRRNRAGSEKPAKIELAPEQMKPLDDKGHGG